MEPGTSCMQNTCSAKYVWQKPEQTGSFLQFGLGSLKCFGSTCACPTFCSDLGTQIFGGLVAGWTCLTTKGLDSKVLWVFQILILVSQHNR